MWITKGIGKDKLKIELQSFTGKLLYGPVWE